MANTTEYSRNALRVVDALLLLFVAVFIGEIALVLHRAEYYLWNALACLLLIGIPSVFVIILVTLVWKRSVNRLNIVIGLIFFCIALLIAEILLPHALSLSAQLKGFDLRSKLDVTLDLRLKGEEAYPSIHPINLFATPLRLGEQSIIPLSGVADVETVFCNELGEYYIYHSDEYGFNNPKGLWSSNNIDIALLGDSFTHGACAPRNQSYAELLRKQNSNLINAGLQGDGPLLSLATLRELVIRTKPKRVLWFYFEGNDIEDLTAEMLQPIIKQYRENPSFTQNIAQLYPEINIALKEYVNNKIKQKQQQSLKEKINIFLTELPPHLIETFKLWNLRQLLGVINFRRGWVLPNFRSEVSDQEVYSAFNSIIAEAKSLVSSYGGELIFVYLPTYEGFEARTAGILHPWRGRVLNVIENNKIQLIDLLPVFNSSPDPLVYYPFRGNGHYSIEGNRLVAEEVLKGLKREL